MNQNTKTYNTFVPTVPIPPGETLLEAIDDIGMTQAELAGRLSRPTKTVNEIIKGKTAISPETALQLEKVLNIPAHFWNNLEATYRGLLAGQQEEINLKKLEQKAKEYPYSEMAKIGWIEDTKDTVKQIKNLLLFFGATTFDGIVEKKGLDNGVFRISQSVRCSLPAMEVWLRKGVLDGRSVETKPFDKSKLFKALPELRAMTRVTDPKELMNKLSVFFADKGVAFVVIPNLRHTPVNGSTRWLTSSKVLLQMSIRLTWVDIFWFSLFHELGHIFYDKKNNFNVDLLKRNVDSESEKRSDDFARETLIPDIGNYIKLKEYVSEKQQTHESKKGAIEIFSNQVEIHPGIVVGRLQHDKVLSNNEFNGLRTRYKWVD